MSETSAKAIRAAREAKAKRLGSAGDPKQKVDASTWTPPEMMNTNAKTGLRPVSRRAFKRGGKVGMEAEGSCGPTRADRKPRKSGGEAKAWMAAKINRDVKEANAELGKPHIGGMKKGGRAKRQTGGMLPEGMRQGIQTTSAREAKALADEMAMRQLKRENPPPPPPSEREPPLDDRSTRQLMDAIQQGRKTGGRTKKMDGGMSGDPRQGAAAMMQRAAAMGNVPQDRMGFSRLQKGRMATMAGLKKGGKVSHMEWEHSKADLEQDKKLAKKHGMSMEKWEKSALDAKHDKQQSAEGLKKGGRAKRYAGGAVDDRVHKLGGGTLSPRRGATRVSGDEVDPRGTFLGRVGRGSWSDRVPPGTLVYRPGAGASFAETMPMAPDVPAADYSERVAAAQYTPRGEPFYAEDMAAAAPVVRRAPVQRAAPRVEVAPTYTEDMARGSTPAVAEQPYLDRLLGRIGMQRTYETGEGAPSTGSLSGDLRALGRTLGFKKGGKVMEGNYTGGTRPTGGRIAKADGGDTDKYAPYKNDDDRLKDFGKVPQYDPKRARAMEDYAKEQDRQERSFYKLSKRKARKVGGRAKGKTNIIISINPGAGAAGGPGMMPPGNLPPGAGGRPGAGAMPVPVAGPPGAGAPPPMPMPVPVPMPMGAGAGGPPMPPPGAMPRKAGGRAYRSYKDMDAGAGSGLGRLEKTEIQEHKRGERKAGGKVYRSYKDMDAGAGSGLGRLEKTEIQARKR